MNNLRQGEAPLARSPDTSARLAGCGRTTIYSAIKAGSLRARKCGRRTLILDADLRGWLSSLPAKGAENQPSAGIGADCLKQRKDSGDAARQ